MNSPLSRVRQCVFATFFAAILSGCAALNIDVDVYKGPLINNEDAQRQQMVSMALSAKALIAAVRDDFLFNAILAADKEQFTAKTNCGTNAFSRKVLVETKIESEKVARRYHKLAIQLNDLLTLYDDYPVNQNLQNQNDAPQPSGHKSDFCLDSQDINNAVFSGRGKAGIDQLARKLAEAPKGDNNAKDTTTINNEKELESALVDIATRMRFLATNQWISDGFTDGSQDDIDKSKKRVQEYAEDKTRTLLEAIGNSILIFADDIQRRDKFKMESAAATPAERTAQQTAYNTIPAGTEKRNIDNEERIKDVMDQVIATLKYKYIAALETGGDKNNATKLRDALVAARRERASMIYIRPSSTYLRSVFTAIFAQPDPTFDNDHNLLNNRAKSTARSYFPDEDEERNKGLKKIRNGLDKANWQNINNIKVSAMSGSNFAIAKDDVGNWYVKSMGQDPSAMVKAAKNLALYNLGGKFDTNLLRVDTLRDRVDDTTLSGPERTRAANELKDITRGGSGPAVAAHGQTMTLFTQNYEKQSELQRGKLESLINQDAFANDLLARWALTMRDSPTATHLATLNGLLDSPAIKRLNSEAKKSIGLPVKGTSADASGSILTTLELLSQYDAAIKNAIVANADLVAPQKSDSVTAEEKVAAFEKALTTSLKALKEAEDELAAAEKASIDAPSEANTSRVNAARPLYQAARTAVQKDTAALSEGRAAAIAAKTELSQAIARQQSAIADTDAAIGKMARATAAQRIRAIEEMETAINVVGQSAGGASAGAP